jgi:hypothetical protein
MPGPRTPHFAGVPRYNKDVATHLRERWTAAYGRLLAMQLEPTRRYSMLRVGAAEFAYTRYDHFVQALAEMWAAGRPVEQRPSVLGSDLPDAAPGLRGVDSDLGGMDPADFDPPVRFA